MDHDGKSTASSFYGGRKSSFDALNHDFPPPSGGGRPRADSNANSFYGGNARGAYDATPSAGYNNTTFFDAGRVEPVRGGDEEAQTGGWDVFADFNNTGPRYSTAFGGDAGYQPVAPQTPFSGNGAGYTKLSTPSIKHEDPNPNGVEMVTVPALGPEWKASELRGMSKAAKREEKLEKAGTKWKQWRRGERGMCGKYFTQRFTVWFVFFLAACAAILVGFLLPRVPSFNFDQAEPISPASGSFNDSVPTGFSRAPANFSFPAIIKIKADTGSNYLPLTFGNIHGEVFDLSTNRKVASGDTGKITIPAKDFPIIPLPLTFTYVATNDSDQTWANWYNACRNRATYPTGQRPSVQVRLVLDMKINGLPGHPGASTQISDAGCPIELSQNSA